MYAYESPASEKKGEREEAKEENLNKLLREEEVLNRIPQGGIMAG